MLKNSFFVVAAVLTPITFIAAQQEISGLVDFFVTQPLSQREGGAIALPQTQEIPSQALVSRARLRFDVAMAKHWDAHVQAQLAEYNNAQLGLPIFDELTHASSSFEIAQAYVDYQWSENLDFRLGKIPLTPLSMTQMGYQSPIGDPLFHRTAGTLYCAVGAQAGIGSSVVIGPVRFDISVWQQTPNRRLWDLPLLSNAIPSAEDVVSLRDFTALLEAPTYGIARKNFRGNNITLSYATRLALLYHTRPQTQWALGLGYSLQQLNMPIVIATIGAYDQTQEGGDYHPPNYHMTSYNRLVSVAFDATRAYRWWLFQLGYQYQRLRADHSQHYYYEYDANPTVSPNLTPENATSTAQSAVLNHNGLAQSLWFQLGGLLYGERYLMDIKDGSVAGIQTSPRYGALELYARFAIAHRHNALALLTQTAVNNMSTNRFAESEPTTPPLMERQVVDVDTAAQYLLITVDNTGSQENTVVLESDDDISYRSHEDAYVLGVTYALTPQSQFKLEYEMTRNTFKKEKLGSWQRDLFHYRTGLLRLRWETLF